MLHPNNLFSTYKKKIQALSCFGREGILTEEFRLYSDKGWQIYYAPHNEYINTKAKIMIVGITPGWSQTQKAYQLAKQNIDMGFSDEEICFECKIESRFAGPMRQNLIAMLDELDLQSCLNLASCIELFNVDNGLLHTTSLIKYPCFYKGKNYSGHSPSIDSVDVLKFFIQNEFAKELYCMEEVKLLIPLGAAVEKVLRKYFDESLLNHCQVLWGFPHPSGLNAHRTEQFQAHKESMKQIVKQCIF